jgi:rod shape-determining protein MreC
LFLSLSFIFNSNYFHKSKVILFSNSITNYTNEVFENINWYFELKKINSSLVEENLILKNQLEKFIKKNSIDSLENVAFQYQNAKVISNNLSSFKNNLIINKGTKHGLKNEMGVISSTGIVGIIDRTSKNYSSVMSVLNTESKINAKVKRTSHFGTLEWNGLSNRDLLLNDIPETADIKIGDSIITGGMSLIFPEGINIGVISDIMKQEKFNDPIMKFNINNQVKIANIEVRENYLNIEVKLHTDMNNLNNVYVIESLNKDEFENIKK